MHETSTEPSGVLVSREKLIIPEFRGRDHWGYGLIEFIDKFISQNKNESYRHPHGHKTLGKAVIIPATSTKQAVMVTSSVIKDQEGQWYRNNGYSALKYTGVQKSEVLLPATRDFGPPLQWLGITLVCTTGHSVAGASPKPEVIYQGERLTGAGGPNFHEHTSRIIEEFKNLLS